MIHLLIYINAVFLLIFIFIKFSTRLRSQILIFLWSISNIIWLFYLFNQMGADTLKLTLLGIKIPLYSIPILVLFILFLSMNIGRLMALRLVIIFIISAAATLLRRIDTLAELANLSATPILHLSSLTLFVCPYIISLLCPLTIFISSNEKIADKLFAVSKSHTKYYMRVAGIIIGFYLSLILAAIAVGIDIEGYFSFNNSSNIFGVYSILNVFFCILINHFVFFGLAKYTLDTTTRITETSLWEIAFYAALFAVFQFQTLSFQSLIREYLLGLSYAYLFIRTKSLIYGISIDAALTLSMG